MTPRDHAGQQADGEQVARRAHRPIMTHGRAGVVWIGHTPRTSARASKSAASTSTSPRRAGRCPDQGRARVGRDERGAGGRQRPPRTRSPLCAATMHRPRRGSRPSAVDARADTPAGPACRRARARRRGSRPTAARRTCARLTDWAMWPLEHGAMTELRLEPLRPATVSGQGSRRCQASVSSSRWALGRSRPSPSGRRRAPRGAGRRGHPRPRAAADGLQLRLVLGAPGVGDCRQQPRSR